MIIAISGKINSGKDTIGKILQILLNNPHLNNEGVLSFLKKDTNFDSTYYKTWQIKKFADKLKDIVCLLIGCTREQLEDREFKEKELGEEWWYIKKWYPTNPNHNKVFTLIPYIDFDSRIFDGDDACMWETVKTTPRLLLQLLGTECGRQIIHPNIWVNALMSEYKIDYLYDKQYYKGKFISTKFTEPNNMNRIFLKNGEEIKNVHNDDIVYETYYPNWIITDMRFPNELKTVKDKEGITIRVNRPDVIINSFTDKSFPIKVYRKEHESETALDNTEFDYVIDNSGTLEELVEKVREILIKEKLL